jgi:hypothetical protein
MNISFNVKDELGVSFISASRWDLKRSDLTDAEIIKKSVKKYMGLLIDSYNRSLVLETDQINLVALRNQMSSLQTQSDVLQRQLFDTEESYRIKQQAYDSTVIPTDPDAP